VAYDPSNYINGVDQRTIAQQRKDEKEQAMKRAAKLKEGMRGRILNAKTKSPSATDVQSGKVSGAVKSSKSKTTVKETPMDKMKKTVKPGGRATKEDIKNLTPKGPAKPNTMKKAPATGMKTTVKKAAAKPMPKKPTAKPVAPAKKTPMPKVTKKPEKMTPQDAAMKKILEKKYGKIYG
jgi:hypothetical protein